MINLCYTLALSIVLAGQCCVLAQNHSQYPRPKAPTEALAAIRTADHLQVELVAAEPLVQDPVAFDWGPDGRLWVVEMRDYPAGRDGRGEPGGRLDLTGDASQVDRTAITMDGAPGGRIKVLSDTSGDGKYDRATVFLDNLPYPTGVKVWGDGVLVACAPNILFASDQDGDNRADVREVLYSGFGVSNTQHRVSFMRWGLDNWLHVVKGQGTREVKSRKTGNTIDLGTRDLRIRSDTGQLRTRNGATRFGHCRNDWGDWFGGGPQTGTWHYVLDDAYLQRNPFVLFPSARRNVSAAAVRVYPASASLPRFNRPEFANHITSACGRSIYRDELFSDHFGDSLFICEPAHNLVHRRKLGRQGVSFESERVADELQREFFASADNWSRPVMVRTGPDGALWVADMYRFVIEHPWDIPAQTKRRLDLLAGSEFGRIYRIYPQGALPRSLPRFKHLETSRLVQELRSPNGWRRDMSQQMLIRRNEKGVIPQLERMATDDSVATARLHALCTLDGLAAIGPRLLIQVLQDPHPALRRHAIRLSETLAPDMPESDLADAVLRLSEDPAIQVRMQLAYSLGQWPSPRSARVLGEMLADSGDQPYFRAACLSSSATHTETILQTFLSSGGDASGAVLNGLARTAVGRDNRRAVSLVISWLREYRATDASQRARRFALLAALLEASRGSLDTVARMTSQSDVAALGPMFDGAREIVSDSRQPLSERQAAIAILGYQRASLDQDLTTFADLLRIQAPVELQLAAIRQLGRMGSARAGQLLLRHLVLALPASRELILNQLLIRPTWTSELLELTSQDHRIAPLIGPANRRRLLKHLRPSIRARASALFAESINQQRQQIVDQYQRQLRQIAGDLSNGRQVYQQHCAACHQFQGIGKPVGPNLATLTDHSTGRILVAVLDPNRVVADKFISYTAVTDDGRVYSGMVADESTSGLTLISPKGEQHRLLRKHITELTSTGVSLMPEGIEKSINVPQMADLIAFLQQTMSAVAVPPTVRP